MNERHCPASVRSAASGFTAGPMSRTRLSSAASLISTATTCAPSRTKVSTPARPMPEAAAVTTANLFSRRIRHLYFDISHEWKRARQAEARRAFSLEIKREFDAVGAAEAIAAHQ